MSPARSSESVVTFAKRVATEVCLKLSDETCKVWKYDIKIDFLDYHITYFTDNFKKQTTWSVFDSRPIIKHKQDPDVYIDEIIDIDYNQILGSYKKVLGESNENKNDTWERLGRSAKRNIASNRKLS